MSTTPTQTTDADDDNDELARIDENLDVAFSKLSQLADRVDDLEAENETLRARNKKLESRISELEGRTNLLHVIESSDEMTAEQRSATLLQHLQRDASNSDSGTANPAGGRSAAVNRKQAEIALQHPDVDRTTIYDDMKRAVRLVGDEDVCWYESDPESRLCINLEAGDLPAQFNGGE